jgi:hypothetical protein
MATSLSLMSFVAGAQTPDGTGIPVPKGAYAVTRRSLEKESAQQLDFKIRLAFPNSDVADFYENSYSGEGWRVCRDSGKWTSRVERAAKGSYLPTRQRIEYLASEPQRKILLVALRYPGRQEKSPVDLPAWGGAIQNVTVVLYELQSADFGQAYAQICQAGR